MNCSCGKKLLVIALRVTLVGYPYVLTVYSKDYSYLILFGFGLGRFRRKLVGRKLQIFAFVIPTAIFLRGCGRFHL